MSGLKMDAVEIRTGEKFRGIKNPEELGSDLDGAIWVDCEFTDCELSGAWISDGIFSMCHFEDVCLYSCFAYGSTFIDCKFLRCDLRRTFDQARFIRCGFEACEVGDNGMGGTTAWKNAVAVECVVIGAPLPIVEGTPI